MMTSVSFRGEQVDVERKVIEDDPTTNAYEMEFEFVDDPDPPATGEENESILCELAKIEPERVDDDMM